MDPSPKTNRGPLSGLAKLLHLHQLPHNAPTPAPTPLSESRVTISPLPSRIPPREPIPPVSHAMAPAPASKPLPARTISPAAPAPPVSTSVPVRVASAPAPLPRTASPASPPPVPGATYPSPSYPSNEMIITDYDRIYDLVRARNTIKLDEIARLLSLSEERIAQELQTLEDNGLVDVKYPAFGEPLICYKPQES